MQTDHMPQHRINARDTDRFDVSNTHHYSGPNPLIGCEALAFVFTVTGHPAPWPAGELVAALQEYLPNFREPEGAGDGTPTGYARLFTAAVSETGRLGMRLHLDKWSVNEHGNSFDCAVQCMHLRSIRECLYLTWDLFEAIQAGEPTADFRERFEELRDGFGASVFGGPTTYALWRAAYLRDVPLTYLWDEGLVQYGYGRRQVRGASTTFDRDSQLDSDFTTRKDDCKSYLESFGFPTPLGRLVTSYDEALQAAEALKWPVVVKPLAGHKGKGVTANITGPEELERAVAAAFGAPNDQPGDLITETFLEGDDHRLLCVDGELLAAVRRRPATVTGDGRSTVQELVDAENATPRREDTPASALGKIVQDNQMSDCLTEQDLDLRSVPAEGREVWLRRVANLSLGGVSEAVTEFVHPDNAALCRAVSQHLRLVCLGIDVLCRDISKSWKEGGFGIIEINAAPGISMHLRPGSGRPVDVPSRIIETFFRSGDDSRIPVVAFNRLSAPSLNRHLDAILSADLQINPGGCCGEGVRMRRDTWPMQKNYGANIRNLLRTPTLDLLIAECPGTLFSDEGLPFDRADILALEEPTATERLMTRYVRPGGVVLLREGETLTVTRHGEEEVFRLSMEDEFHSYVQREIRQLL